MKDYDALQNAVFDLLSELRIDGECLEIMSKGYSSDYPGVKTSDTWKNPYCKVQISRVVAEKLLNTLDL